MPLSLASFYKCSLACQFESITASGTTQQNSRLIRFFLKRLASLHVGEWHIAFQEWLMLASLGVQILLSLQQKAVIPPNSSMFGFLGRKIFISLGMLHLHEQWKSHWSCPALHDGYSHQKNVTEVKYSLDQSEDYLRLVSNFAMFALSLNNNLKKAYWGTLTACIRTLLTHCPFLEIPDFLLRVKWQQEILNACCWMEALVGNKWDIL